MLGLFALALFLFRGAVFGGQALFIRDINMVWYPQVEAFVRCVASGSWPLWDPWRGFGQPLLADPSAQVLYPTTWLNLVAPPWTSYTFLVVFHLTLGSAGMYALGRRWGMSRPAAFFAGGVWMASGPLLSLTTLWHHLASASWIPWVLCAADSAMASGRLRGSLLWALATAAQILAGSADMVALTAIAVVGLAASGHMDWRVPASAANLRVLRSAFVAALLAVGLSAALWVPTLTSARHSQRWELPDESRTTWSLPLAGAAGTLWPVRLSRLPLLDLAAPSVRDLQAPWLYSVYLGAGTVVLVVGALAAPGLRRKRYLAGLCLVALLMSLGRYAPIYDLVTGLLPPLRILRFPVKWMVLYGASWALLAGLGVDAWGGQGGDPRRWRRRLTMALLVLLSISLAGAFAIAGPGADRLRALFRSDLPLEWRTQVAVPLATAALTGAILFTVGILLVLVAARGPRVARVAAAGAAVLGLGEIVFAHRTPQPLAPRELFTWRPAVLDHLDLRGHARVYVYDYSVRAYEGHEQGRPWGYPLTHVPVGWSVEAGQALGVHLYLNPPTAERWGIYGSFDLDLLGLHPAERRELNVLLRRVEGTPVHLRLLQVGAVGRVLGLHADRWWAGLVPVASEPGLFATPIRVFDVPRPLPRAYVVSGVRVADGAAALALIQDPGFDPEREVILEGRDTDRAPPSERGTARIQVLDPDYMRVEADGDRPGYLVLVDGYDPGWKAAVDGEEAPVLRANVAFRAVPVPPGRHRVELWYRPRAVMAGLAVSLVSCLATAALWVSRR